MRTRIAVDGLGRVGRNQLRLLLARKSGLELAAVNDPRGADALVDLLRSDRGGRSASAVSHEDGHLLLDGHRVPVHSERDPGRLPWAELGVDLVIDATESCACADTARKHLAAGAKKVIRTAPSADDDGIFLLGVNEETYDAARHHVISSASCTTNSVAPVAKVFHEAFGIDAGQLTTLHAGPADPGQEDVAHIGACSAGAGEDDSVASGAETARAIERVLPALDGRLDSFELRAPETSGSITHLTVTASRPVTAEEVKAAYRTAAEGSLKGILRCADDEIALSDTVIDPHSSILDETLIRVVGSQVKISTWYEDEWGYSHRLTELAEYVAERLHHR